MEIITYSIMPGFRPSVFICFETILQIYSSFIYISSIRSYEVFRSEYIKCMIYRRLTNRLTPQANNGRVP